MVVLGPFQPTCSLGKTTKQPNKKPKNPECSNRTRELDVAAENGAVFVGDVARGWIGAKKSSKEQESGSELPKSPSEVPR